MRARGLTLLVVCLLLGTTVLLFWRRENRPITGQQVVPPPPSIAPPAAAAVAVSRISTTNESTVAAAGAPDFLAGDKLDSVATPKTNQLAYRLANTTKKVEQLLRDDRVVLLENALIDTAQPLGFAIPEALRATGDPGSYIIQAKGPVTDAFRAALAAAGAEIVSYIPNNAYLVRASAQVAGQLASQPQTQTVLPWEPAYKLKAELVELAWQQKPLPPEALLNLLIFDGAQAEVAEQLQQLNASTVAEINSFIGTVITVKPGADWVALARLPGVQVLERAYPRVFANDLSRVRIGVATDTVTTTNYLGLTGTNVLVAVNDSGVDATHPDFTASRLFALDPLSLIDSNGHGTHVAGIIAGSGLVSTNVTNARGSINPGTNGQYRGVAPGAKLFVQNIGSGLGSTPDRTLQENVARTNAFISHNSWNYLGDSSYSLAAASYDAAVRDSLPGVTGSQPVLYVFSAGNTGNGGDNGIGGTPGTVNSPATAKNVISVGAIELPRDITNIVEKVTGGTTNTSTPWKNMTSSASHVAGFSARGNVGIGIEGEFGRFKPDVVAPGTFVISTRSTDWDEAAYYNPTNYKYTIIENREVAPNTLDPYEIFLPENTVGFEIQLLPNEDSPTPFPNLPLYVRRNGTPTITQYDLLRTNFVAVPPDLGGPGGFVGQNWSYAIRNPTANPVNYDIFTTLITTNERGNYYTVLSNLNNSISSTNAQPGVPPNYYRYESGTTMAAAAASGSLALMQEFFEQRLRVTNSPALMKALLINGARSVGDYNFQVQNSINYQGWGLVRLDNSLQVGASNAFNFSITNSLYAVDQSPTNALATGQSRTWTMAVDADGQTLPLRITLAWTDPPGNPAAGVKLVNDLDLIITNNSTGDIYFGNDIPGGRFNFAWDTNEVPNIDAVNNIENVYLNTPLGTNYSITVIARRVNVNAVTAHTNNVVQDFALVISSGAGEAPGALQFVGNPVFTATNVADVVYLTNTLVIPGDFSSAYRVNQRVGANTPLLGTTNGLLPQWKFYVMTNTTDFTNATFLVSQQTDLAVPRLGMFNPDSSEATRRFADIDMYVSSNPQLLALNPAVLASSVTSRTRNDQSGDEYVIFDDSTPGAVYYIAVKSEDSMAAQFEFWGIFSLNPLGAEDGNGFTRAYPMGGYEIPDGTPSQPGGTRFIAITRSSLTGLAESVRRVLVTNNVTHENFGDLIDTLDHNSRVVVLDNHRTLEIPPDPVPPGPYTYLYDDSGEGDYPTAVPPDGPGTFETFSGEAPGGTWYFTYSDDRESQTGRVNDVRIRIERQPDDDRAVTNVIAANSWQYFTRNVPVEGTNLTVCIDVLTAVAPGPLQLYIRKDRRPTATAFDFTRIIDPSGCLTVDQFTLPPLSPGRYFIAVFNGTPNTQTYRYRATVGLGPTPTAIPFNGVGNQPMLDDAITNYSTFVTNTARISQLEVGLRLDHPRVSDLAVTLISPRGTRVLLVENRGGTDPNGFGSSLTVTNFVPVNANGGPAAQTNVIETGSTAGAVTIDYDFLQELDQMTVYYDGIQLTNTGMINGTGRFTLNYGPGTSTIIEVRMNELGNPQTNTLWAYTVSSINQTHSYLVFTENTNRTPMPVPVKFALPPFVGTAGTNFTVSDFEPPVLAQPFVAPTVGNPDGWSVLTNIVTVITNTANTGVQSLALDSGLIRRTLPTTPGRNYRLNFAHKAAYSDGIISWWPGDFSNVDIVGGDNGVSVNGASHAPGLVGDSFNFDGVDDFMTVNGTFPFHTLTDASFEFWVNPHGGYGPNAYQCLFWTRTGATPDEDRFNFYIRPDSTFNFDYRSPVGNYHPLIGDVPVTENAWTHLAIIKTGNTYALYTNGVLAATVADPTPELPGASGWRFSGLTYDEHDFNGQLDEVTIYNRALTAGEVQSIFAAGAAGKCGMATPPEVCSPPAGAQIFVPGQVTNSFFGTTNWQQGGLIFTAITNTTDVFLSSRVAHSYDPAAEFSLIGNPNGPWSYGYSLSLGSPLIRHATSGGGGGLEYWSTPISIGLPWVARNSTASPINWAGTTTIGPGALSLHPGPSGQVAILRFTAPAAGQYQVVGSFFGQDYVGPNTTDVHLLHNGTSIFDGTITDYNINHSFSTTVTLAAGSHLDFAVGFGSNSSHLYDSTGLSATIVLSNAPSGVLVDSFTLTESSSPRYVLPEESLKVLDGEFAYGEWQLEIWDSRTGATNAVSLVNWQLQFLFQTNTPVARSLRPGIPVTTTIPSNSIAIYIVDVPVPARFATNILFGATPGPLGFYFNQFIAPVFQATNPLPLTDTIFTASAVNWTEVMDTTTTTPLLLPGQRYYLAIENQNPFPVTYTIMVDFDLAGIPPFVVLTNGIPYCAFNGGPSVSLDYYRYTVSSNALRAQFEISNPSGDMTLLLRKDLPPAFNNFSYLSASPFTNSEVITVFDFSQPVPLTPGDWYLAAANISGGPVSYCVKATEWPVYGTNIVITNVVASTNSLCLTWTSLPGVNYFVEGLTDLSSTNWLTASPTITAVDYSTTHCIPLPSPLSFFRVREGIALNLYAPPPVISRIRRTFNGIELTWGGPTNAQYQVQWTPLLVPTTWTSFTNPPAVTSGTGLFQFLDNGSETGGLNGTRFYRLLLLP